MPADNKWLRAQYRAFNKRYFHDELPVIEVEFEKLEDDRRCAETCFDEQAVPYKISLDSCLTELKNYAKIVLLHEMIHVAIGNKEKAYHGYLWKKERKRLIDAGAFTPML